MSDIFLTDEHKKLKEEIHEWVQKEFAPRAVEIDERDLIPKDLLKKLVSPPFKLSALSIPRKYGGLEMDKLSVSIITEEIGYASAALIPFVEVGQLFTYALLLGGTDAQRKRFFTRIVDGDIGCYALTDEGPGSDPAAMKSVAEKAKDGYTLKGKKRLITFADIADLYLIFARAGKNGKGISAFVVEKGSKGLKLEKHVECFGLRGHRAYNLVLDGLAVPADNLVGKDGEGLKLALEVLTRTRISLATGYVGLARAALDTAVKFAKERHVGGKPICDNQAISFPLAELATEIDAARLLSYRAALMSQRGMKHRKETSMAKMYSGQVLIKAVDLANRVLGGFGSMKDYPVERYLRDAYTWIAAQGTMEVQKLIISRDLFA